MLQQRSTRSFGRETKVDGRFIHSTERDNSHEIECLQQSPGCHLGTSAKNPDQTLTPKLCFDVETKERVLPYLGVNVNMSVTSLLEHFTVVVECLVRTVAVGPAVLSPLFGEKDLALPGQVSQELAGGVKC